jgi:hypothetical protein
MKVTIIKEPSKETEKRVYQYLYKILRNRIQIEMQEALKSGKTEEEFWKEYIKKGEPSNAENKG